MCTPLHLKLGSILGFQRFSKCCFERKHLSCDLSWQFVVGDQLAHRCLTLTKVFSLTGKRSDSISSFCLNYLQRAHIFPWSLSSACSTVIGLYTWTFQVPVHLLTSSCLRCDLRESHEQTQGVVSRLSPLERKKKKTKKKILAHLISHSSLSSPCFIAVSAFNSCPLTRCLINVHILCKRK